MNTIQSIEEFLAWSLVFNIGILFFSSLLVIVFRDFVSNLHAKLFSLDKKDVVRAYFSFIAQYKLLIIFFNLVPYLVLRMM